jgi:hypothetical protein
MAFVNSVFPMGFTVDLSIAKHYIDFKKRSSGMKIIQRRLSQFIIPVFYSVAMLLVVYFVWNGQYPYPAGRRRAALQKLERASRMDKARF